MEVLLASKNKNKIAEIKTLLSECVSDINVLSLDDINYNDEIEETGTTFEENAKIKAKVGADLGYICIADDSGLAVDALGGAPGVYSARYSGYHADDETNNTKLLSELQGVPDEKRTARYVCVIACIFPDGKEIIVKDTCEGKILTEYRGNGGFGYDPLFFVDKFGKTFAELSMQEKNTESHRGKAMRRFCQEFFRVLKGE
ncbi:MAG: XTP/dITP diphosphatase [Ruminococcaceae bacterium]|nr:XTP/dITP diphosphatase [Oscillospiraceae bacterium]